MPPADSGFCLPDFALPHGLLVVWHAGLVAGSLAVPVPRSGYGLPPGTSRDGHRDADCRPAATHALLAMEDADGDLDFLSMGSAGFEISLDSPVCSSIDL